jgi:hypothetical protein
MQVSQKRSPRRQLPFGWPRGQARCGNLLFPNMPNGCRVGSIGMRDVSLHLAIGKPLERFLTLVGS